MKTFKFNNGEIRFSSQIANNDFKLSCVLWNCFDENTGNPLPYTVQKTTQKEMDDEKKRLSKIQKEFEDITERNNQVSIGNKKVLNATNIYEFLNAYL